MNSVQITGRLYFFSHTTWPLQNSRHVYTLSAAGIDSGLQARPRPDSAPILNCEPPGWADAAGPDEATGPSTNRKAQTWAGCGVVTRSSGSGRCASENRLHLVATTG